MQIMNEGESGGKDDLLGLLLESNMRHTDEHGQSSLGLTTEDVVEECKLFYFARMQTTSALLTWAMVLLSMHPEWQDRAREEVLGFFGRNKPEYDGLSPLGTVSSCCNLLSAPFFLQNFDDMVQQNVPARSVQVTMILSSCTLRLSRSAGRRTRWRSAATYPAGVVVELPVLLIHPDPDVWGSDVHEFRPDRFAEGVSKAPPAFFPFSWGPRTCIGHNFALLEAKMALSMILQRFEFELAPSYTQYS
ncbi:11-oxo-beta-amyrin 30-oxidase [Dichanthelium oligosanthes]|uniref:11-oxo-beta-amyrin 30-oxidase n=1 Tax=Dichanthelium oligosanthes TaxID=888268 RepID=A0A1E5UNH8_9POAL|nr:11-oxo-beta-amyrin 30-oxidase [Dichanthelium oligosanthes]